MAKFIRVTSVQIGPVIINCDSIEDVDLSMQLAERQPAGKKNRRDSRDAAMAQGPTPPTEYAFMENQPSALKPGCSVRLKNRPNEYPMEIEESLDQVWDMLKG